jgi:hypothetical protein
MKIVYVESAVRTLDDGSNGGICDEDVERSFRSRQSIDRWMLSTTKGNTDLDR